MVTEDYLAEDNLDMVFQCLDTLATVKINGRYVGKADNMHRAWRFDVKDFVHTGENIMEIDFKSPITYVESYVPEKGREITFSNVGTMYGSQYIRKAHSMFGWDWGAQLPDIGILRPIELEAYSSVRLLDVEILQKHENGTVDVLVNVPVEKLDSSANFQIGVSLTAPDGSVSEKATDHAGDVIFHVATPQLWWPTGYGEQPLYEVKVYLRNGDKEIDFKTYKIGLRTIEVSQEKDQWGNEFAFKINGIKIFVKGANYIPEDCVYPWINKERLERLTDDALFANFNCLRIWGGGYYPSEEFFDICDRKGILIWQDLMYACNIYDLTPEFIENIREEARYNVTRLRHHASLAMWCGNNEMETAWVN